MNLVDALMVVVIVAGFIHGTIKGAIQEVSAAIALIVGVIVAGKVATGSLSVTSKLAHPTVGKVFMFVITFIVVAIAIGLLGKLVSNLAKKANLSPIDRILGGAIGACLVGIAAGVVFNLLALAGLENQSIVQSPIAQKLMSAVSYLTQFMPRESSEMTSVFYLCRVTRR